MLLFAAFVLALCGLTNGQEPPEDIEVTLKIDIFRNSTGTLLLDITFDPNVFIAAVSDCLDSPVRRFVVSNLINDGDTSTFDFTITAAEIEAARTAAVLCNEFLALYDDEVCEPSFAKLDYEIVNVQCIKNCDKTCSAEGVQETNAMRFGKVDTIEKAETPGVCCQSCTDIKDCTGYNWDPDTSECYILSGVTTTIYEICADPAPGWYTGPRVDKPNSDCEGFCGTKSDSDCWCDANCAYYGDCCDDVGATCGYHEADYPEGFEYPKRPEVSQHSIIWGSTIVVSAMAIAVIVIKRRKVYRALRTTV